CSVEWCFTSPSCPDRKRIPGSVCRWCHHWRYSPAWAPPSWFSGNGNGSRPMAEPVLSVVIAAWPNLTGLEECLDALRGQVDSGTDVLVASTVCPTLDLAARFSWVSWSQAAPDRLIPHLWGLGMAQARGQVLAITTAQFTPAPDWIQAIRSAHKRWPCWAIGGR